MKIKSDFITNSSSAIYIIYLPEDYYPNEDDVINSMSHHMNNSELPEGVTMAEHFINVVPNAVETLREEGALYYEDTEPGVFFTLIDTLPGEFIIKQIEASEGQYTIIAIRSKDVKKAFMEEALKEIEVKDEKK